ncbi:MAG: LysR family transcriptional regulator [Pseudomonadota bacterium]
MNANDLQAFLAVADCASFSQAAERLHLTQPAVSKRVQALEASLRCRLFDRVGKSIYLTDAGRLLRPRAEALLRAMRDTERELADLDRRVAGELGLATSHHVGLHRLAPALRTFTRRYPDVALDIRFEDSEEAHDLVRRAETEIAVVTLNPDGDPELTDRALWDDPLLFVASQDHELSAGRHLTLRDLAGFRPVLPGLGTYTGRIVANAFAAEGLAVRPNLATNYLETIAMLVGIGLGWSVLPASMVKPPLAALDVAAPSLRRTLGCVTHPRRTLSNAARAFQDVLLGYADPGT